MENNEPGFQSPKYNGPWINATHPGGVNTDQQEQAVEAYGTKGKLGVKAVRPFLKDPVDEGAGLRCLLLQVRTLRRKVFRGNMWVQPRRSIARGVG